MVALDTDGVLDTMFDPPERCPPVQSSPRNRLWKCPCGDVGNAASRNVDIKAGDGVEGLELQGVVGLDARLRPVSEKSVGVAGAECTTRVIAGPGSIHVEYFRAVCTAGGDDGLLPLNPFVRILEELASHIVRLCRSGAICWFYNVKQSVG